MNHINSRNNTAVNHASRVSTASAASDWGGKYARAAEAAGVDVGDMLEAGADARQLLEFVSTYRKEEGESSSLPLALSRSLFIVFGTIVYIFYISIFNQYQSVLISTNSASLDYSNMVNNHYESSKGFAGAVRRLLLQRYLQKIARRGILIV